MATVIEIFLVAEAGVMFILAVMFLLMALIDGSCEIQVYDGQEDTLDDIEQMKALEEYVKKKEEKRIAREVRKELRRKRVHSVIHGRNWTDKGTS